MKRQEAEEIIALFKSKTAHNPELLTASKFDISRNLTTAETYRIYNGTAGTSDLISSIHIEYLADLASVELFINHDRFVFIENSDLCKELIERFVIVPETQKN